ncbi:hypothetical protein [Candidatus Binatus sp.]|uniref:hypothetical protein n=1 Tax=Candidatus Binatus sp. TaxID=2811406 RepID=UPI002F3FABE0
MKGDLHGPLDPPPSEERAILDEIRNDHDLIRRLSITQQELEALSKCALLGTLTCKQDMLFILRQIREASSNSISHTLFPQPPEVKELSGDFAPSLRGIVTRPASVVIGEPESPDTIVRGRIFRVVALVSLVGSALLIIYRWRDLVAKIGAMAGQATSSGVWYAQLDHLNVLLFWEILIVGAIVSVMFLKSQRGSRRFKVRPGRRQR